MSLKPKLYSNPSAFSTADSATIKLQNMGVFAWIYGIVVEIEGMPRLLFGFSAKFFLPQPPLYFSLKVRAFGFNPTSTPAAAENSNGSLAKDRRYKAFFISIFKFFC